MAASKRPRSMASRAEPLFGAFGINEVEYFVGLPVFLLDIDDKSVCRHWDSALSQKGNHAIFIWHRSAYPHPDCGLRRLLGQSLPGSNPKSNRQRQRTGKCHRPRRFPSHTRARHATIPFLDPMSTLPSDREHNIPEDKSQGRNIMHSYLAKPVSGHQQKR